VYVPGGTSRKTKRPSALVTAAALLTGAAEGEGGAPAGGAGAPAGTAAGIDNATTAPATGRFVVASITWPAITAVPACAGGGCCLATMLAGTTTAAAMVAAPTRDDIRMSPPASFDTGIVPKVRITWA
jgi:hypothetical protein